MKAVRTRGYEVAYTKEAMEEAASLEPKKVLKLFAHNGKTPELFLVFPDCFIYSMFHDPCLYKSAICNPKSKI
jgi:hypothetical protein